MLSAIASQLPVAFSHLAAPNCLGAIAQLGEHLLCKQGVVGSIPSGSTNSIHLKVKVCGSRKRVRLFCKNRKEKMCSDANPGETLVIGVSSATLNRRHYDWSPNRTTGQISRSWSFRQ